MTHVQTFLCLGVVPHLLLMSISLAQLIRWFNNMSRKARKSLSIYLFYLDLLLETLNFQSKYEQNSNCSQKHSI